MQCTSIEHNELPSFFEYDHSYLSLSPSFSHTNILVVSLPNQSIDPSTPSIAGDLIDHSHSGPKSLGPPGHGVSQPGTSDLRSKYLDGHPPTNPPSILLRRPNSIDYNRDNESHQFEPLFSPPLNPLLSSMGPLFVNLSGEALSHMNVTRYCLPFPNPPLNQEVQERENNLGALRESNREIETLLA